MTDDMTSETLRDRLDDVHQTATNAGMDPNPYAVTGVAQDAIEYAAQLEDRVEDLRDLAYVPETHPHREPYQKTWREEALDSEEDFEQMMDERDEARAERDRLRDMLKEVCSEYESAWRLVREEGGTPQSVKGAREALREVERGDTVERIRREAFKEAAALVERPEYISRLSERKETASAICALAEADDQEDGDDEPFVDLSENLTEDD